MSEFPPYRGGRVVAACWRGGSEAPVLASLRRHLEEWAMADGEGWLIATDRAGNLSETRTTVAATTVPRLFDRESAALRDVEELAPRLADRAEELLDALGAPFRLVWIDKHEGEMHAATDPCGLGHLFWAQVGEVSICASSSLLLAQVVGAAPSLKGIASFALCGTFPFAATPYQGVARLLAGNRLRARAGRVEISERALAAGEPQSPHHAFAAAVRAMDRAASDATLELSGGLDSRLILAALPRERRAGHPAITIADGDSRDLRIARHIAAREGLRHSEIPLPRGVLEDGEQLSALLEHVMVGYDTMANPIDRLPLVLTLGESEAARMGGQNGEIIRGFYYPMQPLSEPASRKLVEGLVDWRIVANDRVPPEMFAPATGGALLASAREGLIDALAGFGGAWGDALDQVYLRYRMQSWVGCAASCRFIDRASLWPFFDADFLAAAMALDPRDKRDSRAAYGLLAALDPALAAMPLDSGLVPAAMIADGVRTRVAAWMLTGRKAARKVMQRIRPRADNVLGSVQIVDCWHAAGAYKRLDLHSLASLGLFENEMLEAVGAGRTKPDRATLGFLLLCETWARVSH